MPSLPAALPLRLRRAKPPSPAAARRPHRPKNNSARLTTRRNGALIITLRYCSGSAVARVLKPGLAPLRCVLALASAQRELSCQSADLIAGHWSQRPQTQNRRHGARSQRENNDLAQLLLENCRAGASPAPLPW